MSQEDFERMQSEPDSKSGRVEAGYEKQIDDPRRVLADLLPAYSIGALDAEDAEFVHATLAGYPDLAEELSEYRALNRALLHSAGTREPSRQLAGRLCAAIQQEAKPPVQDRSVGWRERLFGGGAQPVWPRLAVAGALALLIALNVAAVLRIRTLQAENQFLAAQLSSQQEALAMMTANSVQIATLPAAGEGSGAQATVRYSPDGNVAVVSAEGFPALEPDKAYQLWLIRGEARTSGGLFTVDSNGAGTLVVWSPDPVGSFDAMGITPEPAAGSPGPTSPPVVVGKL